ncbi:MAG: hypothetical protein KC518_13555, partial [Candidatus Cloacimonetes bacterium]|nr:hypothetical protein [Candidatus Cloacimonadota bacterium]
MRILPVCLLCLAALRLSALPLRFSLDLEEGWELDDNVLRISDHDIRQLEGDPQFQPEAEGPQDFRMDHRMLADVYMDLPGRRTGRLKGSFDAKV